jgi:DNA-binding transcriptional regulator YiaG
MLMYPLGEAVLLLSEKLSTAKKNLNNIKEDLEFLREQVTVMEVNFARVHNVSHEGVLGYFCGMGC